MASEVLKRSAIVKLKIWLVFTVCGFFVQSLFCHHLVECMEKWSIFDSKLRDSYIRFKNRCQITNVKSPAIIANEQLWERINQPEIEAQIKERK